MLNEDTESVIQTAIRQSKILNCQIQIFSVINDALRKFASTSFLQMDTFGLYPR